MTGKFWTAAAVAATAMTLAACGSTMESRAATGAATGLVIAGPVGAAVGAGVGAAVNEIDEADKKN